MIKYLMKTFQNFQSEKDNNNWEIFNHKYYLEANEEDKKKDKIVK